MSRNLLLLGVAAALCLLAGEALLRARGFGRPLRYEWDERLAWRMAPDQRAHAPSYGVAYRTNSRGLRDDETALPKPPGVFRIVGLGDSVLFGQGVPREETVVERLEARLSSPDRRVEVVNAAVSGYTLDHYRVFLDEALGYQPDLVLLGLAKNDLVTPEQVAELRRHVRDGLEFGLGARGRLRGASAWLHLLDGLVGRVTARLRSGPAALAYARADVTEEAWRFSEDALAEIARALRARGVPLVVAVFPYRAEIEEGRVVVPVDRLRALAAREGFRLVDLRDAFLARASEGPLFHDVVHPTTLGHAAAAEALLPVLRESGSAAAPQRRGNVRQTSRGAVGRSTGSARTAARRAPAESARGPAASTRLS